jgi:hypothetical protein
MITTKTFNKRTPVAEGCLFRLFGVNSTGYAIFIENQDTDNTIVYTFQESISGSTWTDIEFSVNGESQADFSLLAGSCHLLKVTSSQPYIRLMAYGDAYVGLSVSYYKAANTGTSEVQIFESA